MKKSIWLILAIGIITLSCKKDDNDVTPQSKLVGTWKLISEIDEGEVRALDDCEKKSTIVLNDDKSILSTNFDTVSETSECAQKSKILGFYDVIIEGKLTVTLSLGNGSPDQVETLDYSITGQTLKIITIAGVNESSSSYQRQ